MKKKTSPQNRTPSGQFQPGQSGNPGGRPKADADVKALAREQTPEAISRLVFWMKSDNANVSVSASIALLDRGWGRPVQAVSGPEGGAIPIATTVIHEYHAS